MTEFPRYNNKGSIEVDLPCDVHCIFHSHIKGEKGYKAYSACLSRNAFTGMVEMQFYYPYSEKMSWKDFHTTAHFLSYEDNSNDDSFVGGWDNTKIIFDEQDFIEAKKDYPNLEYVELPGSEPEQKLIQVHFLREFGPDGHYEDFYTWEMDEVAEELAFRLDDYIDDPNFQPFEDFNKVYDVSYIHEIDDWSYIIIGFKWFNAKQHIKFISD